MDLVQHTSVCGRLLDKNLIKKVVHVIAPILSTKAITKPKLLQGNGGAVDHFLRNFVTCFFIFTIFFYLKDIFH